MDIINAYFLAFSQGDRGVVWYSVCVVCDVWLVIKRLTR